MKHISFSLLDKTHSSEILDELYDILYGNMSASHQRAAAMKKTNNPGCPVSFPHLRTHNEKAVEWRGWACRIFYDFSKKRDFLNGGEQFKPEFPRCWLFGRLYRYLFGLIPSDTDF